MITLFFFPLFIKIYFELCFIPLNCWKAWGGGGGGMLFTLEEFLESGVYFCF